MLPLFLKIKEEHGREIMELCRTYYLTGLNDAIAHLTDVGSMSHSVLTGLDPS